MAGYIGTRTKEECEQHYHEVFLGDRIAEKGTNGTMQEDVVEAKEDSSKRKREFMPVCPPFN